jgi:DNA-binding transcriptional ArsR family regulator
MSNFNEVNNMKNTNNAITNNVLPSTTGFIKINFDPKTTIQAEEALLNGYGLDLTNPDFIKYQNGNLEAEVIGGINTIALTRFQVMLKISRRPQLSAGDVYRNNVDLYNENNLQYFVKQASIKLKLESTKISDFIYDLTERLETYRKDKITNREEKPLIMALPAKEIKKVDGILKSETLLEDIQSLLCQSGMPCGKIALELFLITLSSKQTSVMHGILQGNAELTSEIIKTFSSVLPLETARFKTSISDSVLYYAPNENYWKNKVLLLPSIDTLGKKNTAITELILQGQVNRLVTENTEQGTYRASNKSVNGNLSFISSTAKGYHELMNCDTVMALPISNSHEIKEAIVTNQIKRFAGLLDENEILSSQRQLQSIFREIKSMTVINPYLEQLNVSATFNKDNRLISQFLRMTNLIALLHQKQLSVIQKNGANQIEVQPRHMLQALELFREIWFKQEKELSFNVAGTLIRIKKMLVRDHKESHEDADFLVKDMRAKLKVSPSSLARHINILYDYGKLERTGGNQRDGYSYKVTSWNDSNDTAQQYETFKNEILAL